MADGKLQPFISLNQSKHHCYTLSTTCTLFKLASEVGPRTVYQISQNPRNDRKIKKTMERHGCLVLRQKNMGWSYLLM